MESHTSAVTWAHQIHKKKTTHLQLAVPCTVCITRHKQGNLLLLLLSQSSITRRCPDYSLTPEDALTIASYQWVSNHACSLLVLSCKPERRLISPKSQPSSQLSGHLTNIPHHDHFFLPHADHHLSFSGYSFSEPPLMVMAPLRILISSPRPHHFLNCKPQDATKLHLFT